MGKLMDRNPHISIHDEPIKRKDVQELRSGLQGFWEDTLLVTEPNKYQIISVGNLEAILDTLLHGKQLK